MIQAIEQSSPPRSSSLLLGFRLLGSVTFFNEPERLGEPWHHHWEDQQHYWNDGNVEHGGGCICQPLIDAIFVACRGPFTVRQKDAVVGKCCKNLNDISADRCQECGKD